MMGASTGTAIGVLQLSGMRCNGRVGVDDAFACGCARCSSASFIRFFAYRNLLQ